MKIQKLSIGALSLMLMGQVAQAKPVTLILNLRERIPISDLAHSVQDPVHAHFGVGYTPEEIRKAAGPSDADYDGLLQNLKAEHIKILSQSPTHLTLKVVLSHRRFNQIFHTKLKYLDSDTHHSETPPIIPIKFALIESIGGVDNRVKMRRHPQRSDQRPRSLGAAKNLALDVPKAALDAGLTPAEFYDYYNLTPIYDQRFYGHGQTIAIVSHADMNESNILTYFNTFGNQGPNDYQRLVRKVVDQGAPYLPANGSDETENDVEIAGMVAPRAQIVVYITPNSLAAALDAFNQVLDDGTAKTVSYSWGSCETKHQSDAAELDMIEKTLIRAAAQAVNVFVAAGDDGSSDNCSHGQDGVDFPASAPHAISVGGTDFELGTDGPDRSTKFPYVKELAWMSPDPGVGSIDASGGGYSRHFAIPDYQQSVLKGLNPAPFGRGVPDVSAFAAGYAVYTSTPAGKDTPASDGAWTGVSGTSLAAPAWAAYLALVNEGRAKNKKPAIGFLNPILYAMPLAMRNNYIYDVLSGGNGTYSAGVGWDPVTGLGSMQGAKLFDYLTKQ